MEATMRCPGCGSERIVRSDAAELVCARCGLVIQEGMMDLGPEWRSFEQEQRARSGPPLTEVIHDRGLSTRIGGTAGLSPEQARTFGRLRKLDRRAGNHARKFTAVSLLQARACQGLPQPVRERAASLYRRAQGALRGYPVEEVAGGTVCFACREFGIIASAEEVARACGAAPEGVEEVCRRLREVFPVELPAVRPERLVEMAAAKLALSAEVVERALELARRAEVRTSQEAKRAAADALRRVCRGSVSRGRIVEMLNAVLASSLRA